jgi:hypothetical protein
MNSYPRTPMHVREARAAAHRPDSGEAFLPDPTATEQHGVLTKTDVEFFAEEFIASATAGEQVEMEAGDEVVTEEWGGPFLELEPLDGDDTEVIPEPPTPDKLPPGLL